MRSENSVFFGGVVGLTFSPNKENFRDALAYILKNDVEEPEVQVKAEPDNEFDKWAIQVAIGRGENMFEVGYIPKFALAEIHKVGIENTKVRFVEWNVFDDEIKGLKIEVTK